MSDQTNQNKELLLINTVTAELEYIDSIQEEIAAMTNEDQQKWVAYRNSVERILSQEGFPDSVVWPLPPNHHSFSDEIITQQ